MENKLAKEKITVLRLRVKKVSLCLNLKNVNKILPLMMLEAAPYSPSYLIGLLNFGGNSIPVIDLAVRLGYERTKPYSIDTPIVLCSGDSGELALVVDKVLGLAEITADSLQQQQAFSTNQAPFLGSVAIDHQLTFLLNIEQLFDKKRRQVKEAALAGDAS